MPTPGGGGGQPEEAGRAEKAERLVAWKSRERVFPEGSSQGLLRLQTGQVGRRANVSPGSTNNQAVRDLALASGGREVGKEKTSGGVHSFGGVWV